MVLWFGKPLGLYWASSGPTTGHYLTQDGLQAPLLREMSKRKGPLAFHFPANSKAKTVLGLPSQSDT